MMVVVGLSVAAGAASAEQMSEQRAIDARVLKVKLGSVVNLRVKQGATPSLVLIGEKRDVARVSVVQSGETLTTRWRRLGQPHQPVPQRGGAPWRRGQHDA